MALPRDFDDDDDDDEGCFLFVFLLDRAELVAAMFNEISFVSGVVYRLSFSLV